MQAMKTIVSDRTGKIAAAGPGDGPRHRPARRSCGGWGHGGELPGYEAFRRSQRDGRRQIVLMINQDASTAPEARRRALRQAARKGVLRRRLNRGPAHFSTQRRPRHIKGGAAAVGVTPSTRQRGGRASLLIRQLILGWRSITRYQSGGDAWLDPAVSRRSCPGPYFSMIRNRCKGRDSLVGFGVAVLHQEVGAAAGAAAVQLYQSS